MSCRVPIGVIVLLVAAFVPSSASAELVDPVRPVAAVAVGWETYALVAWVPGPEAPSFFKIYGVRDGSLSFLSVADADAVSAEVEGDFPQYAVTAVRNGVESRPVIAVVDADLICISVEPGIPPGIGIDTSCTPKFQMVTAWSP